MTRNAPTTPNLKRLAAALRDLQAEVDVGGNWFLPTRHGRLDVMQDVPGLCDYDELRAGAMTVSGARYAGYEQLIAMKAASGRHEDLRDIGALEAARRSDGR